MQLIVDETANGTLPTPDRSEANRHWEAGDTIAGDHAWGESWREHLAGLELEVFDDEPTT